MNQDRTKRKLSAIFNADAVGYSRLMEEDEAWTVKNLEKNKRLISEFIEEYKGRVVDSPGDNILAEFSSVTNAVECAVKIQEELKTINSGLPEKNQMEFRIGVNLGEVIEEDGRIYGNGVNIAARLEELTEPGGICISRRAYDHVKTSLDLGYDYLGEHEVKNISEPVRIYRVLTGSEYTGKVFGEKRFLGRISRSAALAVIIILLILAAGLLSWNIFSQRTGKSSRAEKPSIAVLPFVNMSKDRDNEYFSDGMAEEILNGLSRFSGIIVKARTSSFKFKGKNEDIRKIGTILNVTHVLEGSVRKSGNRIRVTVQLISAKEDRHIWSGQYDRKLTDIFEVQDEITGKILRALNIHLSSPHKKRLPTNNLDAYDAYLLGRQRFQKDSVTGYAEAIEYFKKAIDLDKDFALAYVGLADSYILHMEYSGLSQKEWLEKAETAIERAIRIDNQLGAAYTSIGMLESWQADFSANEKAEKAYKRAIELNPNYVNARHLYAILLTDTGRFKEALLQFQKGIELDPLDLAVNRNMARALQGLGRFDEAFAQYDRVIEIDPLYPTVYLNKGLLYFTLGRFYEAVKMFRRSIALDPESPIDMAILGICYLVLGDLDRSEYWCGQAIRMSPEGFYSNLGMFYLSIQRGEKESAKKYGINLLASSEGKSGPYVIGHLQNLVTENGRYDESLKWFEKAYPELLNTESSAIGLQNYQAAIYIAYALKKTGENKKADLLLNKNLEYIKTLPRLGRYGYGITDVKIYVLLGDYNNALDHLRKAVDDGWRMAALSLEQESMFVPLQKMPGYKAIVKEIRNDMAAQLARTREWEKTIP